MERLNRESMIKILKIVDQHWGEKGSVIVMLHKVQDELGYIPYEAMLEISKATGVSVAEIYGVVNFYAQFTTQPKGKHIINVCLGTACYVKGAQSIIDTAVELTGSAVNSTSSDGLFSVDATRCVGACGLAPVVIIDGQVFGNANSDKLEDQIKKIIESENANSRRA